MRDESDVIHQAKDILFDVGDSADRRDDMDVSKVELHTIDEIRALPEGKRAELLDGVWYDMAAPGTQHQRLVMSLSSALHEHIRSKGGKCEVFPAPFAVFLNEKNETYVEPDVSVICDASKLKQDGCHGAPDLVIEITSPSTLSRDYVYKLNKYQAEGVREYWIVDPTKETVMIYDFSNPEDSGFLNVVDFDEPVPCTVFPDLNLVVADNL